jgi:cyclin-dependent kinase regulatory subunit CKS1
MSFQYSEITDDCLYLYRQVVANREVAAAVIEKGLLGENEWRDLGIQMSRGWNHYTIYSLDPSILLFRKLKNGTRNV